MLVRDATLDDVETLVGMGERFWGLTEFSRKIPYSAEDVTHTVKACIDHRILLIVEDEGKIAGFLGGLTFPIYANTEYLAGQELFWWVEPEYRSKGVGKMLLDAAEARAKELGLVYWTMLYMTAVEPEVSKHIYAKRGYRETEVSFTKEV